ncbi:tRNA-specific 2-thiouridylase MnmA-like [Ylistrum balloti]|uniref:tRNA-specific 2-thiouridylase MnmA-like n=1 Tax=Ylistrum balloti TaxID=509963 RepID=UPI002905D4DE|nr:tRNA-specific 2-thiouridylase MnmA-like [Ylistrum balloti]
MSRIAALVSGGVDSSVAVHKFITRYPQQKNKVHLYYLKIWLEDELSFLGDCPWEEDLYYVRKIAAQFDIPYTVIPLQKEYQEKIISYTVDELKKGATPSPDIFCNTKIKLGAFLEYIDGADTVITGHYARIYKDDTTRVHLLTAADRVKDQSYFLSMLSEEQITLLTFPLGAMQKFQVREYAQAHALSTMHRKDSQGLCFLGKIKFRDFIREHLGVQEGSIIDERTGKVLGTHEGTWFYTIGQRNGLGLGSGPWYVARKSLEENIIWVQHAERIQEIASHEVFFSNPHWIRKIPPSLKGACFVKIRHGPALVAAQYTLHEERGVASLTESDCGIAEGQYLVFYTPFENKELCKATQYFSSVAPHEESPESPVYECMGAARIFVPQ